jgi:molybdenum cofactor cytidylyltransferase
LILGAVVLAAGASIRMGAPKPLVRWRQRSFVGHVVDRARAAGCEPIVVVQGAHAIALSEVAPARLVANARWADGPTTSLQVGLAAMGPLDVVVVATVDRPHVAPATWAALVAAARGQPEAVWQPRFDGRRGHPLVLPAWLLPHALALPADATLRDLLARPDVARCTVDVDDPAVLDNLDAPADLARLPE